MQSAWAYLNISEPLVAWLVYRADMVSADQVRQTTSGWTPLSIFHTARLRQSRQRPALYQTELAIETVRARRYPNKVSRLTGFYVFADEADARRAEGAWDGHFRSQYLNEVGIADGSQTSVYDSTWITEEFRKGPGGWIDEYLSGRPHGCDPLWETVVEGQAYVFGTDLRERAHETIARTWPKALGLLELGRIAAELGSSLGMLSAFAVDIDEGVEIQYAIDMRDATDDRFISRVREFTSDPSNPVNYAELAPISSSAWFARPDLRARQFRIPR